MSTRSTHKAQLEAILETISFNNGSGASNIVVNTYYTTTADKYPYCFITSGEMESPLLQSRDYKEIRFYNLNVVFRVEADGGVTETLMDTLEGLIVAKLQPQSTRDSVAEQDLRLVSVSSPYQNDVSVQDGCIIKSFLIQIDTITHYS